MPRYGVLRSPSPPPQAPRLAPHYGISLRRRACALSRTAASDVSLRVAPEDVVATAAVVPRRAPSAHASCGSLAPDCVRSGRLDADPAAPGKLVFRDRRQGAIMTVEELALRHYAQPEHGGWSGVHDEGGVVRTLFGLLLWDVVFADVPDVFRSPYQVRAARCPLSTRGSMPTRRPGRQNALTSTTRPLLRRGC